MGKDSENTTIQVLSPQYPQFGQIMVQKHGEDYVFCAQDVCATLELENVTKALYALDDDEKLSLQIVRAGQRRELNFITESGLYALVIRSNKPQAKPFRRWVTHEVLPALRKYGFYSTDKKVMAAAERKVEKAAVKNLLKSIRCCLSYTDKKIVSRQCYTTEWDVEDVLNGCKQNAYMLGLLYARATGNKILHQLFYTKRGAEQMTQQLEEQFLDRNFLKKIEEFKNSNENE